MNTRKLMGVSIVLSVLVLPSCNVFSIMDGPGNDQQYLDAGRACFDQLDYACALENYGKVTDPDFTSEALSETAFVILHQNGLPPSTILSALFNAGSGLGEIANLLVSQNKATTEERVALFAAFEYVDQIDDPRLKGLTRLLVAAAIAGEILAENAGSDGIFTKADMMANPTTCAAADGLECSYLGSACDPPSGSDFLADVEVADDIDPADVATMEDFDAWDSVLTAMDVPMAADDDRFTSSAIDGEANLNMFHSALYHMTLALSDDEIFRGSDIGDLLQGATSFVTEMIAKNVPNDATQGCYMQLLVSLGVGE